MDVVIDELAPPAEVEIVEHKGVGHPDTICDALAESFAQALCRYYREHFGAILHFNVDKALLVGGEAESRFGGGEVLKPMQLFLAGRATRAFRDRRVPVEDIAIDSAKRWLREHMHALDPERHVTWNCLVGGGSQDLVELFSAAGDMPLANDTSLGVGHAPATVLERTVLALSDRLRALSAERPEIGEDIKIMALRRGRRCALTVACAFVDRAVTSLDDYLSKRAALKRELKGVASGIAGNAAEIEVNAADDAPRRRIYLTVTGTSAEAGDDGEVGRGNRVGGLISPGIPMSLEAAAGKNPVSHVGKLYNVLAQKIAERVVTTIADVAEAHCFLLSRIGHRIDDPVVAHVRIRMRDGSPADSVHTGVRELVHEDVSRIRMVSEALIAGRERLF